MKDKLTYKNGKIIDFFNKIGENNFIFPILVIIVVILALFSGMKIVLDAQEQATIGFAQAVCGDGKIDSIRQWASEFGGGKGIVPVSYSIVCIEPIYGIKEIYYFYLVPDWVVSDENGNLMQGKTVMWGGLKGQPNWFNLNGVINYE